MRVNRYHPISELFFSYADVHAHSRKHHLLPEPILKKFGMPRSIQGCQPHRLMPPRVALRSRIALNPPEIRVSSRASRVSFFLFFSRLFGTSLSLLFPKLASLDKWLRDRNEDSTHPRPGPWSITDRWWARVRVGFPPGDIFTRRTWSDASYPQGRTKGIVYKIRCSQALTTRATIGDIKRPSLSPASFTIFVMGDIKGNWELVWEGICLLKKIMKPIARIQNVTWVHHWVKAPVHNKRVHFGPSPPTATAVV